MTTKSTLLRDVAKLLKKHKLADLNEVVSSLGKRTQSKSQPSSKARWATKRTNTKSLQSPKTIPSTRTKKPTSSVAKSRKRNQAKDLKRSGRLKANSGTPGSLRKGGPPDKKGNVRTHGIGAALEDLRRSLAGPHKSILEDRGQDYERWFRIISGDAVETKPADLAAESRPREIKQSKDWREAVTHLRIQDLLLSGPFKLISSSPHNSRTLTFLPDGAIGTGRTHLVARWRLSEGRLELLNAEGEVQSRFTVSSDGRFLTQILDPTAASVGPAQLVRVAAKS